MFEPVSCSDEWARHRQNRMIRTYYKELAAGEVRILRTLLKEGGDQFIALRVRFTPRLEGGRRTGAGLRCDLL